MLNNFLYFWYLLNDTSDRHPFGTLSSTNSYRHTFSPLKNWCAQIKRNFLSWACYLFIYLFLIFIVVSMFQLSIWHFFFPLQCSSSRFYSSIPLHWQCIWPKCNWTFTETKKDGPYRCWNGMCVCVCVFFQWIFSILLS